MTTKRRTTKKLHRGNNSAKSSKETPAAGGTSNEPVAAKSRAVPSQQAHPLMSEVESFIGRRHELARKLAKEIEATEKKLADLKKIAASLFPQKSDNGQTDRKSKKRKA